MELTVNNNDIALPADGSVSIEKNSPVFNDNVGAFSYPFAVPKEENEGSLGYPGRAERANKIPIQKFSLYEDGIHLLAGEVDYDPINDQEIGLILQSGNSEFSKVVKGKKLSDLNLGSEPGYADFTQAAIQEKLDEWNTRNAQSSVNDYVCCPFAVKDSDGNQLIINGLTNDSGTAKLIMQSFDGDDDFSNFYCMQFSTGWLVQKVFEALGYTVTLNEIVSDSFLNRFLTFGKIFRIYSDTYWVSSTIVDGDGHVNMLPGSTLYVKRNFFSPFEYGQMAPDWDISGFISAVKMLLGVVVDIDERQKKVSIYRKKTLFDKSNIVEVGQELEEFSHEEDRGYDGFKIEFSSQDDELATESDFNISGYVDTKSDMPTAGSGYDENIILVKDTNRYYKCINENSAYSWKEIGRLKSYSQDNAENIYTINATVPRQVTVGDIDIPEIEYTVEGSNIFEDMGKLAFTLFRGTYTAASVAYPLLSFDRYTLDGIFDFGSSLKPEYLYTALYKLFVDWQTYRARECDKYVEMDITDAVSLKYNKRLKISNLPVLINQINFDLPYPGFIKINGFFT